MIIFQFHIRLWSEPLMLRVGFFLPGDPREEAHRWGHYSPSKSDMFIINRGWEETLLHEIVEGNILNGLCHFSTTGGGSESLLMVMNHDQFTTIIQRSYGAFTEVSSLLREVFGNSYHGNLYRPEMGLKMPKDGKVEKIGLEYKSLLRKAQKGQVPLAGIYQTEDKELTMEEVAGDNIIWFNPAMCDEVR